MVAPSFCTVKPQLAFLTPHRAPFIITIPSFSFAGLRPEFVISTSI